MCIQNLVRFCPFVLELLSGNKILTSTKGRNSVKILRKITGNNPKLDLVNVDVHTKFGQILSIRSQDIERKRNSDVNILLGPSKGNNSSANLGKLTCIDTYEGASESSRTNQISRELLNVS